MASKGKILIQKIIDENPLNSSETMMQLKALSRFYLVEEGAEEFKSDDDNYLI